MWIYDVPVDDIRLITTEHGHRALTELHHRFGKEIWTTSRTTRRGLFHRGGQCAAEWWPRVLGGRESCADCESFYLDLLVRHAVARLTSGGKKSRAANAPAAGTSHGSAAAGTPGDGPLISHGLAA